MQVKRSVDRRDLHGKLSLSVRFANLKNDPHLSSLWPDVNTLPSPLVKSDNLMLVNTPYRLPFCLLIRFALIPLVFASPTQQSSDSLTAVHFCTISISVNSTLTDKPKNIFVRTPDTTSSSSTFPRNRNVWKNLIILTELSTSLIERTYVPHRTDRSDVSTNSCHILPFSEKRCWSSASPPFSFVPQGSLQDYE